MFSGVSCSLLRRVGSLAADTICMWNPSDLAKQVCYLASSRVKERPFTLKSHAEVRGNLAFSSGRFLFSRKKHSICYSYHFSPHRKQTLFFLLYLLWTWFYRKHFMQVIRTFILHVSNTDNSMAWAILKVTSSKISSDNNLFLKNVLIILLKHKLVSGMSPWCNG